MSGSSAEGACESEQEPEQVLEVFVPRVVVIEPPSETRHVPIGNPDMPPSPPSRETSPRDMSETTTPCESPEPLPLGTVLQTVHMPSDRQAARWQQHVQTLRRARENVELLYSQADMDNHELLLAVMESLRYILTRNPNEWTRVLWENCWDLTTMEQARMDNLNYYERELRILGRLERLATTLSLGDETPRVVDSSEVGSPSD